MADVQAQTDFPALGSRGHFRTFLAVPLRQRGEAIGGLQARRTEMRPFSDAQIKLLETFADQAVIAIENVRLFDELQQKTREQAETLEEQAATNHILEIISQSPTDVQPVLDAIVDSAARVVGVDDVVLKLVEGDDLPVRAHTGPIELGNPIAAVGSHIYRWVREHGTLHIADVDAQDEFPELHSPVSVSGTRTYLHVPLWQRGAFTGVI